MKTKTKWITLILGAGMLVTLVALVSAFSVTTNARAQEATIQGLNVGPIVQRSEQGFPGRPGDFNEYLANELGISVEELQAAQERAHAAALDQAVEDGLISEDMLEMMEARQALQSYLDPQEMFAQALGIDTAQLEAYRDEGKSMREILDELGLTFTDVREAHQAAFEQAVQEALKDGAITQEQADLIQSGPIGAKFGGFFGHGRGGRGGMMPPGGSWEGMPKAPRFNAPSDTVGTSL